MTDIEKKMKKSLEKMKARTNQFASVGGLSVSVGLPSDRIHNPSGLPLSELGAIHEFGLGEIPERSFLRGFIINNKDEITKQLKRISKKASGEGKEGPVSAEVLMEQFALWAEGGVKEYIADGAQNFLPLARPRKDGSENPLNDTGAMKQGVIGVVVSSED